MNRVTLIAWVDVLHLLVIGLFMMLVAAEIAEAKKTEEENPQGGNLSFYISWDRDRNVDVDMWLRAPGDVAVGYTRKNGLILDLLRDDLGAGGDLTGENFEIAFSRGFRPGEYIANLVLFRSDQMGSIEVNVIIQCRCAAPGRYSDQNTLQTLWSGTVTLETMHKEVTAIRLTLDSDGKLVSQSSLPIQIIARPATSR